MSRRTNKIRVIAFIIAMAIAICFILHREGYIHIPILDQIVPQREVENIDEQDPNEQNPGEQIPTIKTQTIKILVSKILMSKIPTIKILVSKILMSKIPTIKIPSIPTTKYSSIF
jgi:hypothetical protein